MSQDDTVAFETMPHFQLLPMSKVDQSRGYKTFFVLNSTEHKNLTAHKN